VVNRRRPAGCQGRALRPKPTRRRRLPPRSGCSNSIAAVCIPGSKC